MNIFKLHNDPIECAKMHCDKHVVKMILEYAQLLCTAHRVLDGTEWTDRNRAGHRIKRWALADAGLESTLYKATHVNHPSNVWARETSSNYMWLLKLYKATCAEYTHRYGKIHATASKLAGLLESPPANIKQADLTPIAQAMPDQYKSRFGVIAYRQYYVGDKAHMAVWTNRNTPEWFVCTSK